LLQGASSGAPAVDDVDASRPQALRETAGDELAAGDELVEGADDALVGQAGPRHVEAVDALGRGELSRSDTGRQADGPARPGHVVLGPEHVQDPGLARAAVGHLDPGLAEPARGAGLARGERAVDQGP